MMQVHGGNTGEVSRRHGVAEDAIIDFSSNSNPLGFPPAVRALLARGALLLTRYPDTHSTELREVLAPALACSPRNIIVGNGSTELIYLLPRVLKPRRALVLKPTFSEYEKSLHAAGCAVQYLTLREKRGFRVRVEEAFGLLKRTDMIFLCNPNNPTGMLVGDGELRELLDQAEKQGVVVVVDEAFMDFTPQESLAREVNLRSNLIVVRSMTKFFAVPGIRLGYLLAPAALVRRLNTHKEPWTVNGLAQSIGVACMADSRFGEKTRRFVDAERRYLVSRLKAVGGLHPYCSSANYLLVNISRRGLSSSLLYEELAGQGILIRDCRSFKGLGGRFIRVAVKGRRHNRMLIAALARAVEGYECTD